MLKILMPGISAIRGVGGGALAQVEFAVLTIDSIKLLSSEM
jgi:hypothetical protein